MTPEEQATLFAQLALIIVPLGTALAALLGALTAWLRSKLPSADSQAEQTTMIKGIQTELQETKEALVKRSAVSDERHTEITTRLDGQDADLRGLKQELAHLHECVEAVKKNTRAVGEATGANLPTETSGG